MAAWNERRLIRDIYDIWFILQMNVMPDIGTLEKRLRKPSYSRLVRKQDHFTGQTCGEFYEFMRAKVFDMTDEDIMKELSDYLSPQETAELSLLLRASLAILK